MTLTECALHKKRESHRLRRIKIWAGRARFKGNKTCRNKISAFEEFARRMSRKQQSRDSKMDAEKIKSTGFLTKIISGVQNMIGMHR